MVFYRVGIKAPDLGQNGLLGHILPLCLQKIPHHVEFPRGQPQLPLPADQCPGRQIERRVAERERVDLRALPPEQRTDAGQQLPRVKGLREIIIRARVQPSMRSSSDDFAVSIRIGVPQRFARTCRAT